MELRAELLQSVHMVLRGDTRQQVRGSISRGSALGSRSPWVIPAENICNSAEGTIYSV